MRPIRLAPLAAVAILAAACSGATPATAPSASPAITAAATSSAAASPSAAATRIDVSLTDALTIDLATNSVPVGVPVTFVVTNAGTVDHEFYLGDEEAQAHHEREMAEMGGMGHDEELGIGVKPGETKELTVTFEEAGPMLAGCHVLGHYAGGMKAPLEVDG